MRNSIRVKLSIIIMTLVAGVILLVCSFNALFLDRYYLNYQQKSILRAFEDIKDTIDGNHINEKQLNAVVRNLKMSQNFRILIANSNFEPVYGTTEDANKMLRWLMDFIFANDDNTKNIAETNDYIIRISENKYDQTTNLELIGHDDMSMYNIIIQLPLESINKSVRISNTFLLYVGIGGTLLGGLIAFFVARQFTEPIKELSETAKSMAEMNFDVKYDSKEKNEIGQLGNSLNNMSDNLRKYISDLKTANLRLENDIKEKEELDNLRREFIGNISHELKTPIALIQGYAEGLKEGVTDDPENMEYYCDVIMDEAGKMNGMVKQLLTLNHLESGDDVLNIELFDISKHIDELVKATTLLASQKDTYIEFDNPGPINVWADQFKIEEVLTNYISNAINHVKKIDGNAVIKIYIERSNTTARIHVYNSGDRIPDASLDKLWDKFYKVDKARTREYGGSGIGLSIVKAIMDMHKQAYGVTNMDKGVDFYFDLDCDKV